MKLNFALLANQLKNNHHQNAQQTDISSQLNYYRRPTGRQEENKNVKHRKSQLQKQQESSILLGSTILTEYFNPSQADKKMQEQITTPKISLSVMYPYEVSTVVDPNDIDRQIQDLKNKGILNHSAMKFIKKEIDKSLSKSKQKTKKESSKKLNSFNQSIFLQSESIKTQVSNTNEEFLNETQETFTTQNSIAKNILFKNFSKETLPTQQKRPSLVTSTTIQSLKNNKKKSVKPHEIPNYMKPIHEQQNMTNKKGSKQFISTQTLKMQQQLKQVKPKPSLQMTKSSPFTQRIQAQRESTYKHKNTNVFNELYNEAYVRQCMKSLQREQIQKDIQQKHNLTNKLKTQHSKKYIINESFMDRLEKSIEKKYYKDNLINKYSVNDKTGHPFFKPDMTLSKHTYEKLFHRSVQKIKTQSSQSLKQENLPMPKVKKSNKQISVSFKSAARTNQNSVEKLSFSVEKVNNIKSNKSIKIDNKSTQIVQQINGKIINRIVGIFYPTKEQDHETTKFIKEEPHQQMIDFQRTHQTLALLSEQQYIILFPLFEQIQALQQSTNVSTLMFKNLLQQFFNRLNYYDQMTLRQSLLKKKDRLKSQTIKQRQGQNEENSVKNMKKHKNTHQPRINDISSSMQKINPKYDQALYYV